MNPARLMLPGVLVDFGGGQALLLPPLSLGALELLQERLAKLPSLTSTDPEAVSTIIDAALMALKRNYPDLTRAEVAELIDLGNMGEVYESLMDIAGMKRRAQEEQIAAVSGNAGAKSPAVGFDSSPASVPTPDGLSPTSEPS